MEKPKVTIVMHGYGQNVPPGQRSWKDVVSDRLHKTFEVARWWEYNTGIEPKIIVSGGTVTDEVNEADAIMAYAQERFAVNLEVWGSRISLEREAKNTAENAQKVLPMTEGGFVIAISSRDHVPRLMREWAKEAAGSNTIVSVVASDHCYSENGEAGMQPFIAEPPFWAIDALPGLFKVPAEKRADVLRGISRIIAEAAKPTVPIDTPYSP